MKIYKKIIFLIHFLLSSFHLIKKIIFKFYLKITSMNQKILKLKENYDIVLVLNQILIIL